MASKFIKPVGLALTVFLAIAPLTLAQTSGQSSMGTSTTATPSSQMNAPMGAQDTINATVTEVNQQQKMIKLRTQSGEMVDLKVSEQSLMNLRQGDSVQVSIRKAEGQSGTSTVPQPHSGSGTAPSPAPHSK